MSLQSTYNGTHVCIKHGGLIPHAFPKHHKELGVRTKAQFLAIAETIATNGKIVPCVNCKTTNQPRWKIECLANRNRAIYVKKDGDEWIACTMFERRPKQKKPQTMHQRKLSRR